MGIWKNAFKMPRHPDLTESEKAFLSSLSGKIKKRAMGEISAIFLESTRPAHNLGAQSLIFLTPLLSLLIKPEKTKRFVRMLENPKAVDFFIKQLNGDEHGK